MLFRVRYARCTRSGRRPARPRGRSLPAPPASKKVVAAATLQKVVAVAAAQRDHRPVPGFEEVVSILGAFSRVSLASPPISRLSSCRVLAGQRIVIVRPDQVRDAGQRVRARPALVCCAVVLPRFTRTPMASKYVAVSPSPLPVRVSLPSPPERRSAPAPPNSWSLPLPPTSVSSPAPPRRTSLKLEPNRKSPLIEPVMSMAEVRPASRMPTERSPPKLVVKSSAPPAPSSEISMRRVRRREAGGEVREDADLRHRAIDETVKGVEGLDVRERVAREVGREDGVALLAAAVNGAAALLDVEGRSCRCSSPPESVSVPP